MKVALIKEFNSILKNLFKPTKFFTLVTMVILTIQTASLFRSLPTNPACGRVLNVFASLNVLVNCDSAVFMKDAQDTSRLIDGESVYQDRPAHAFTVSALSNLIKVVGFPNTSRAITGNSGEITVYQTTYYLSYLILNLLIVLVAANLALRFIHSSIGTFPLYTQACISLITIFIVSANELTKSFFWTPHSQMFNVLLPILAITLISRRLEVNSLKRYLFISSGILALMFYYPMYGILLPILLFSSYSKFLKKSLLLFIPLVLFLVYPKTLEFLGGSYSNYAISNFRQYVWIIDALKQGNIFDRLISNLYSFLSTFPAIPSVLILITIILLFSLAPTLGKNRFTIISEAAPYLIFLAVYLVALFTMGFYARRLTLGVFIFLELFILRMGITLTGNHFTKLRLLALNSLLILLIISWVWTNGPLE
jgi:hypothetical protein